MFKRVVEKVLKKAREERTDRSRFVCLVLDEAFFLLVAPWFLILPAWFITLSIPLGIGRLAEVLMGISGISIGLCFSLWAVCCQWTAGKGTPSLNAPTRNLVTTGPYRFSRNPIQLGALLYVFGLGTLFFSLAAGLLALLAGAIVGVVYIKCVEEKELAIRFGESYNSYRRRTPLLFGFSLSFLRGRAGESGTSGESITSEDEGD